MVLLGYQPAEYGEGRVGCVAYSEIPLVHVDEASYFGSSCDYHICALSVGDNTPARLLHPFDERTGGV